MRCQNLFAEKNKKYHQFLSAEFVHRVVKVKPYRGKRCL